MGETGAMFSGASGEGLMGAGGAGGAGGGWTQLIGIDSKIASTVAQTYFAADAIKAEGRFAQDTANTNAEIMRIAGRRAIAQGEKKAGQIRKRGRAMVGAQRVGYAGQGVNVDVGSAAEVQEDTTGQAALDAMEVENDAWRQAWGYNFQASETAQAGQQAWNAAKNKRMGTLIAGGASVGNDVMQAFASMQGGF